MGYRTTKALSKFAVMLLILSSCSKASTSAGGASGNTSQLASQASSSTAATTVPLAPVNATAALASTTSITLSWTDASPSLTTGFKIERSTAGSSTYSGIANVSSSSTTYTDSDSSLAAGTFYFYKIRAFNAVGESTDSNFVSQALPPGGGDNPGAPTGLTATLHPTTHGNMNLSWVDHSGGTATHILQRSSNGGAFADIATLAAGVTTYTDTGLSSNLMYFYRVRAYNNVTYSSYSPLVYRRTPSVLNGPIAPGNLMAIPVSDTSIKLTWTQETTSNTGFEVWRSTVSGSGYALIATSNSSTNVTFTDTGLSTATTYYYKVKSINSFGASGFTKYASATPDIAANTRMFLIYYNMSSFGPEASSPFASEHQFSAWVYVPPSYASSTASYPLLIFHHGNGELSTDSSKLITASGSIPNVLYNQTSFNPEVIVVMPQLDYNRTSLFAQQFSDLVIRNIKKLYRIDSKKISMTGLSGGSGRTVEYARAYSSTLAGFSIVAYSPPSVTITTTEVNGYKGLQLWAFSNQQDPTVGTGSFCGFLVSVGYLAGTGSNYVPCGNPISTTAPTNVKASVYLGVNSHDAWTAGYSTDHSYQNPNFWEWLVTVTK